MKCLQKLLKFENLFNDVEIYALLSFKVTKGIILLLYYLRYDVYRFMEVDPLLPPSPTLRIKHK